MLVIILDAGRAYSSLLGGIFSRGLLPAKGFEEYSKSLETLQKGRRSRGIKHPVLAKLQKN